jgi:hypothetical protein
MVTVEVDGPAVAEGSALHSGLLGTWTPACACASQNDATCSTMPARSRPASRLVRHRDREIAAAGGLAAVASARCVTCRTGAVASGVPSSEESERGRQLGRQDVLDHDPGAKVAFGSEC